MCADMVGLCTAVRVLVTNSEGNGALALLVHGMLTQASREIERARLEAIEMREDKARVESESKDLARENRMLQDRLSDGNFRSRARQRDR